MRKKRTLHPRQIIQGDYFMTVRAKKPDKVHIKIENGRFQIEKRNPWKSYWRDPYHLMLILPWRWFFVFIVLGYLLTNTFFAFVYLVEPGGLKNAQPGSFLDAFFFSVQTLGTIGYGAIYPQTLYANLVVTVEAVAGLIGIAIITGLAFARFSKATARVIFSRAAVITPYNGLPTLMFRTANRRGNQILEAQMQVYLMRDEITQEGELMRRFHPLKLLRKQTPSFSLSWTGMHPIDETSPLYGTTEESLLQTRSLIIASLTGIDETVVQMIHARYTYSAQDILWNHRLVDIFHDTVDGNRYIDYAHFHDVEPITPS